VTFVNADGAVSTCAAHEHAQTNKRIDTQRSASTAPQQFCDTFATQLQLTIRRRCVCVRKTVSCHFHSTYNTHSLTCAPRSHARC
jgi:hypothetical protein